MHTCTHTYIHTLFAGASTHLKPPILVSIVIEGSTDRDNSRLIKLEPLESRVHRVHGKEHHFVVGRLWTSKFSIMASASDLVNYNQTIRRKHKDSHLQELCAEIHSYRWDK